MNRYLYRNELIFCQKIKIRYVGSYMRGSYEDVIVEHNKVNQKVLGVNSNE